jgi:hypothetical protein
MDFACFFLNLDEAMEMEKKERTKKTGWLIVGIIIALVILLRIIVPMLKAVDPNI